MEVAAQDIRLELAAALLLAGDVQEARRWRDAAARPPPGPKAPENPQEREPGCLDSNARALLAFFLEPQPGTDPFPLLIGEETCFPPNPDWTLLLARAAQTRYPEPVRDDLKYWADSKETSRSSVIPLEAHLSFLHPSQLRFDAADGEWLATLQAALAALPAPAPATPALADPTAPRLLARLAAPLSSPFTERPLAEAPPLKPVPGWKPPKNASPLPRGFHPLRAERHGSRVLVLALSQRLDPTGEVSGGGYWLLESGDVGRTWTTLYTGLREYRPYELTARSSLPMLDGDTLRLEASVLELEERTITFPPIGMDVKRQKKNLFLETPLSALRQDSDGDGLSDLVEERLLLDPHAADTDGDGLADGEDALPQVAAEPASDPGPRSLLLPAFLAHLRGEASVMPGLEVGLPEEGAPVDALRLPKGPTPESRDDVIFLEMDRSLLAGTPRMPTRTLVITREELRRAQALFGRFYPLRVELLLNQKGDQAFIRWSERWRGGTFVGRWEEGRWVFESKSEWIT